MKDYPRSDHSKAYSKDLNESKGAYKGGGSGKQSWHKQKQSWSNSSGSNQYYKNTYYDNYNYKK